MKYTIQELANSKGTSQPVRGALMYMEAELTATERQVEILSDALAESRRINAELVVALRNLLTSDYSAEAERFARAAIARATGEQA